ncbi:thymidylate synthase [Spirochaetia bacterium]|nr:thymidylate synthase [Spirochaetia bacterium]
MEVYINIVNKILKEGVLKKNRTGINALSFSGLMFEHDMANGFPLLTTKKIAFRLVSSELEFFIKGLTNKEWLRKHNNHIWDEWCNPDIVPYNSNDPQKKELMINENDLGPIYGWQWRNFGAKYSGCDNKPIGTGIDQLEMIIKELKENPDNRRMIVTAWNPLDIDHMALPPCHYSFQLTVTENKLNLLWNQRSVDVALGLPFNIASYATLLHLFAKEANLKEGRLIGFLGDTHIYVNHIDAIKKQIARVPRKLPQIITNNFTSLFEWTYSDSKIENYNPYPSIKFDIAV